MASIFGLDIPPGLVEAFMRVLFPQDAQASLAYRYRPSSGNSIKKADTRVRSLLLIFESTYATFDSTRRGKWTSYWITLPFSPHSGANGWPGSGYSAFLYVNAPRYAAGLDLLLDPPQGELLVNGTFDGNADGWTVDDTAFFCGPLAYYDDHDILFPPADFTGISERLEALNQIISALVDGNYYDVSIDAAVPPGGTVRVVLGVPSAAEGTYASESFYDIPENDTVLTTYTFTLRANTWPSEGPYNFFCVQPQGTTDIAGDCTDPSIIIQNCSLVPHI